jgi:hypothetical protein
VTELVGPFGSGADKRRIRFCPDNSLLEKNVRLEGNRRVGFINEREGDRRMERESVKRVFAHRRQRFSFCITIVVGLRFENNGYDRKFTTLALFEVVGDILP